MVFDACDGVTAEQFSSADMEASTEGGGDIAEDEDSEIEQQMTNDHWFGMFKSNCCLCVCGQCA